MVSEWFEETNITNIYFGDGMKSITVGVDG